MCVSLSLVCLGGVASILAYYLFVLQDRESLAAQHFYAIEF